jgi:hypothetical protein
MFVSYSVIGMDKTQIKDVVSDYNDNNNIISACDEFLTNFQNKIFMPALSTIKKLDDEKKFIKNFSSKSDEDKHKMYNSYKKEFESDKHLYSKKIELIEYVIFLTMQGLELNKKCNEKNISDSNLETKKSLLKDIMNHLSEMNSLYKNKIEESIKLKKMIDIDNPIDAASFFDEEKLQQSKSLFYKVNDYVFKNYINS